MCADTFLGRTNEQLPFWGGCILSGVSWDVPFHTHGLQQAKIPAGGCQVRRPGTFPGAGPLPLQTAWYQVLTLNTQMRGSEAPQGGSWPALLGGSLQTVSRGLPRTFKVQGCNPWGASESPVTQAAPGPVESESLRGGPGHWCFKKVR